MGWAVWAWVRDVAISVFTMIISGINCLNEEWKCIWLKFLANIRHWVPKWSTSIDTTFSSEISSVRSLISTIHSEAGKVICSLNLLEYLTEECTFSFMITLAWIIEILSLSAFEFGCLLVSSRQAVNHILNKFVLHAEKYHPLDLIE